jgi:hypothetical protein
MTMRLVVPALVLAVVAPAPARTAPLATLTPRPRPVAAAFREKRLTKPDPIVPARAKAAAYPPLITVRQTGPARAGGWADVEIVTQGLGGSGSTTLDFGDGTAGSGVTMSDAGCGGPDGSAPFADTVRHAYRFAGTWTVTVTFTPECDGAAVRPYIGTGTVTVGAGRALSNGPALPMARPDALECRPHEGATRTVACLPDYADEDGFLRSVVVDWGDGSRETVLAFPLSACTDPKHHWPATVVDDEGPGWPFLHRYATAGEYRPTVTVTTTGCDGADAQTRTRTAPVTVS